jgi:transcriptional regulator with XRE-family HTH domain
MPKESQERVRRRAQTLLAEMPLQELRQAYQMSQESLAKVLGAKQAAISKLEHRTDMYISTLRDYIEAMGGELEIVARFPDGAVKISQFRDISAPKSKVQRAKKR